MSDVQKFATFAIGLAIVGLVLNPFFAVALESDPAGSFEEQVNMVGGSGDLSAESDITNFTIEQSLGDAVAFSGANDSELRGRADIQRDETWSTSTWARVDAASENETMRALQFGGWLMVDYDGAASEWRVTVYDEQTLNTYQVTAAAPDPTTWTHLVVTHNESELALWVDGSVAATTPTTDGSDATVPTDVANWDGTVEETRVLDDLVDSSEVTTLHDTPTAPVRANESARIYYDAYPEEDSVDVYRTGADLTLSNASFVDGFAGQDLEKDGLLTNGDYRLEGETVVAMAGGALDGAPVAFVSYDGRDGVFSVSNLGDQAGGAISLLMVGLIIIAARSLLSDF